jgi:hypothetical protein
VNLAAMLGNNMCVGAHAQSTFPTRHHSRKVSTLIRHETTGRPFSRREKYGSQMLHFLSVCVMCATRGKDITGAYSSTRREEEKKKVIINHIYDAVREPT